MENQVDSINTVPSKRIFLSIIADYDLNRSVCELIDNCIDIWTKSDKPKTLNIWIDIDKDNQTINIKDNSCGVKRAEISLLISPGKTSNEMKDNTIGIFGVGTKRAVVALAKEVKITTRYHQEKTYRIRFGDEWLYNDDWELPLYEVDDIESGTTIIELRNLRIKITDDSLTQLKNHLEAVYAKFLTDERLNIKLNKTDLQPATFENWAYPPGYSPQRYKGVIATDDGDKVDYEILAGLAKESSPSGGEYGVYIYCNNRLIAALHLNS